MNHHSLHPNDPWPALRAGGRLLRAAGSAPGGRPEAGWLEALSRSGFTANGEGYCYDGLVFRRERRWLRLEATAPRAAVDPLRDQLGRPGLWKWVGSTPQASRVFEFPAAAVVFAASGENADEEASASPDAFLAWALATSNDKVPLGWQPPARQLVESWLPPGALTVQSGPLVRQGELMLAANRWAVRMPLLPAVPADLPEARWQWLRLVLSDAQSLWRMVRFGSANEDRALAVMAEVDLTGAPPSEQLFLAGLDSVRHVVQWLAETAEVLADATVASQALAVCPIQNPN